MRPRTGAARCAGWYCCTTICSTFRLALFAVWGVRVWSLGGEMMRLRGFSNFGTCARVPDRIYQRLCSCLTMLSMDRPRCRRRSSPTGLPQVAAAEAPRPPSRSSPLLKSVAFLGVSAACCASLPSRAEAFVASSSSSSSVRGLETHLHRAGQRAERSERGRISVAMLSERRGLWPGRPTIDLRSDTVTQPTGGMRKAMQKVCYTYKGCAPREALRGGLART